MCILQLVLCVIKFNDVLKKARYEKGDFDGWKIL